MDTSSRDTSSRDTSRSTAEPTPRDRVRQVGVTVAMVLCVVGTLVGTGVIGTRVEESAGGALAADATRLAPAGPAFSIWTLIYLGLAGYAVYQWLPAEASAPRQRAIGWLAAASMLLNAGWLLVTQAGWIWVSVLVILALVAVLGELVRRLTVLPSYGVAEAVLVDGTFGAYLGWVTVAVCANITAALVASGVEVAGTPGDLVAVLVLAVAAGIGVLLARVLGGRYAVALALAWGLGWVAVGRLTDEPRSALVGVAAVLAAVVVLAAPARVRAVRGDA